MKTAELKLERFKPNGYYCVTKDRYTRMGQPECGIEVEAKGIEYIRKYYAHKYQANISQTVSWHDLSLMSNQSEKDEEVEPGKIYIKKLNDCALEYAVRGDDYQKIYRSLISADQLGIKKFTDSILEQCKPLSDKILKIILDKNHSGVDDQVIKSFSDVLGYLITEARKNKASEYRQALIMAPEQHKIPIIYLRETDQEIILWADSSPLHHDFGSRVYSEIEDLLVANNIAVFYVAMTRQSDSYSCGVDALAICKDITAMGPSGEYRIPNLLRTLKNRSYEEAKNLFNVLLPEELLKTAQNSEFIKDNKEESKKIINGKETLPEFLERYTLKDVLFDKASIKKDILGYVKAKGFKFANLIEIQFYLDQVQQKLPELLSDHRVRKEFIVLAKQELKSQGKIQQGKSRKGLYEFSGKFFQNVAARRPAKPGDKPLSDESQKDRCSIS